MSKGVFGGFTSVAWSSDSGVREDNKAFVFSITHSKVFECFKEKRAVYHDSNYGPIFGSGESEEDYCDICINDNCD